jgi:hypothetical protein
VYDDFFFTFTAGDSAPLKPRAVFGLFGEDLGYVETPFGNTGGEPLCESFHCLFKIGEGFCCASPTL